MVLCFILVFILFQGILDVPETSAAADLPIIPVNTARVVPYKDGHTIFVHKTPAGLAYMNAHGFFVVPESLQPPV
jgi:hypothetical protein